MFKKLVFDSERIKKNKAHVIICAVYCLVHLYVIFHHEHWMDEAQAWVIAKNLSVVEMFKILCTEGHPCLWFLFLMPFAKLGLSFYYFSFISLTIMTIAAYVFLNFASFSLIVKTGVLFSSVFLFYNPVVCRSYSLIALLIILTATLYKCRLKHVYFYGFLISLLFQSHVLVFGLAIGLTIDLFIDFLKDKRNKSILISIGMILISFITMVLQIMPRSDSPSGIDTSAGGIISRFNLDNLLSNMQYYAYTAWGWMNNETFYIPYVALVICVILIFVFITINKSWKKNYQMILIAICGLGVFFGVVLLVYKPHTQMASIMVMILLFVLWQLYADNDDLKLRTAILAMLTITSFLTFAISQSFLRDDIKKEYSTTLATAEVLIRDVPENGIIMLENSVFDPAVYSYVSSAREDIVFYDARKKTEFKYYQMGSNYEELSVRTIIDDVISQYSDVSIFYLTNSEKDDERIDLVYTSKDNDSVWKEHYYVYKIRSEEK